MCIMGELLTCCSPMLLVEGKLLETLGPYPGIQCGVVVVSGVAILPDNVNRIPILVGRSSWE